MFPQDVLTMCRWVNTMIMNCNYVEARSKSVFLRDWSMYYLLYFKNKKSFTCKMKYWKSFISFLKSQRQVCFVVYAFTAGMTEQSLSEIMLTYLMAFLPPVQIIICLTLLSWRARHCGKDISLTNLWPLPVATWLMVEVQLQLSHQQVEQNSHYLSEHQCV